jgi:hypothetical protein
MKELVMGSGRLRVGSYLRSISKEPCRECGVDVPGSTGEDLIMRKTLAFASFASVLALSITAHAQTEAFGNRDRTQIRRMSNLQNRQMAAREYRRHHRRRIARNDGFAPSPWVYTVGGYEW